MLLFILVLLLGFTCNATDISTTNDDLYYPSFEFSDILDWQLLKVYSSQYRNVILSPVSLKVILALLYQGAGGATAKEFENVLHFVNQTSSRLHFSDILGRLQESKRSEYLLNLGTSIFLDKQITTNPDFENVSRKYFRTDIKPTNFSNPDDASKSINQWIQRLTNGKVTELVTPDEVQHTIMLITNAVYFKGTWTHQFPKERSYDGYFYYSKDHLSTEIDHLTVPYMTTTDEFYFKEVHSLDAKILRMPYKGSSYSMFFILPNSRKGLPDLLRNINLSKITEALYDMDKRVVDVHIPKFKFNFLANLAEPLKEFGLRQMFQNAANFSGIVKTKGIPSNQLVVSDIVQKSGIEVDEEGSVVYSATDINIGNKFGEAKSVFIASHPFLFYIEGPNGTLLFIGKVENPLEENQLPLPTRWKDDKIQEVVAAVQPSNAQQYVPNVAISPAIQSQASPEAEAFPNLSPNLEPNLDPDYMPHEEATIENVAYRFNLFDIELLNAFTDSTTNVLLSPASVKTTLAMILEGAVGNCAEEISEALRIPHINDKGVRQILVGLLNNLNEKSSGTTFLESYNAVFVSDEKKLVERYQNVVKQFYSAILKSIDFNNIGSAVDIINQWVSESTHGAIKELVSPQSLSPESTAVIANALYFKGRWKTEFDPKATSPKCFRRAGKCVNVPMMQISDTFMYNYINNLRAHAVDLPYQGKFSMLILLPSEEANIRMVVRDLTHWRFSDILDKLKPTDILLEVPKFSFEYSADLVEYLKPLKIRDIFGTNANLSGIVEGGNVVINNLIHKTKIEVDEQGTVAAAATGAMIVPLMGPLSVIADRPFLFMIYHKDTQNIIFEGILQNPLEQTTSFGGQNVPTNPGRSFIRSRQFGG
ncbi:hypothetical protein JTB14_021028 [Gonioctena quinquepunctata]|nr:hypothetical protein JTB14_021028 [Gonioctena quinquepunctata]